MPSGRMIFRSSLCVFWVSQCTACSLVFFFGKGGGGGGGGGGGEDGGGW